ncbi:TPA: sphingomyelin phosphodiesterase [Pseudomonas aeruginosa]
MKKILLLSAALQILTSSNAISAPTDQYKILSYNIFMLPDIAAAGLKIGWTNLSPIERGKLIAQADFVKDQDVIIFDEAFDHKGRTSLVDSLKKEYPYITPVLGLSKTGWSTTDAGSFSNSPIVTNGGVIIFSRHKILEKIQHVYKNSCGWDSKANKGFIYTKIQRGEESFHVIGTHLQAVDSGCADGTGESVRKKQIQELKKFITEKDIPKTEVLFIGGDFNIIKGGKEYEELVSTENIPGSLGVIEPDSYAGAESTYDTKHNGLTGGQYPYKPATSDNPEKNPPEYLDYVFVSRQHKQVSFWHNQALDVASPRWSYTDGVNTWYYQDYSDHYPVSAFTYAEQSTPTKSFKPKFGAYQNISLEQIETGKFLTTTQRNSWLTATSKKSNKSQFILNNWHYYYSSCIPRENEDANYVTISSIAYPDEYITWLGGPGPKSGKFGYYIKSEKPSRQLRLEYEGSDTGECLRDGDTVVIRDHIGILDSVYHGDFYAKFWESGNWKDYLFLWAGSKREADKFRLHINSEPPIYEDWSSKLRY